jgi:site-specific DNA recombinase
MKAALYARFSSDLQRATSIEDQYRNCRKRAEAEGWKIVATFADQAMTGSDASRPQYQAMIDAAMRNDFEALIVDDLSRLTRDSVEAERTIRRLEFNGIRIISTSDGYDSTSKARKVHRGFKGLMNEIFLDDLRERVHRGLSGVAMKHYWTGGRAYGYRLTPILDPTEKDQYGQPARIATKLEIDEAQAEIVKEIFNSYAEGMSCLAIARELNSRAVPHPGLAWKKKKRRCPGWMGSAVRVIIKNPLYTGFVRWNASQFVRNPDTEKITRRTRPKSEWITHQDEEVRIVSDELFERAQARTRRSTNSDERLKSGGKAKYLLSGVLVCKVCGANYVIADARSYACSGHWNGGACSNRIRVRRDSIERTLLGPIRAELQSPERCKRMAKEMHTAYAERLKANAQRVETMPQETAALDARLERLRERLKNGDPDMMPDELQATIERVEAKRRELTNVTARTVAGDGAKILSLLPKAAEYYGQQIALGLDGDPRAAAKARPIVRELLGGKVELVPGEDGSLWAEYGLHMTALLQGAGTCGRGEGI